MDSTKYQGIVIQKSAKSNIEMSKSTHFVANGESLIE